MNSQKIKFTKEAKYSPGFTLIELLVVISIISVLSSVILVSLNGARDKARVAEVLSDARTIYTALQASIPPGASTVNANLGVGGTETVFMQPDCTTGQDTSANGNDHPNGAYVNTFSTALAPYLPNIPKDPWGNNYWIDASYKCSTGEVTAGGCIANNYYYVIGSGGPNGSTPNIYDSDNVVLIICKHP